MMEEDEDVKAYMKKMNNRAMKKENMEFEDIEDDEEEKIGGGSSGMKEGNS